MKTLILGIANGMQPTKALGVKAANGKVRAKAARFAVVLVSALLFSGLLLLIAKVPAAGSGVFPGIVAVLVFVGVTTGGGEEKKIKAGKLYHAGIGTGVFKLS